MAHDHTALLRSHGARATATRLAVLAAFEAGCGPMSAEEVYAKFKNKRINITTVYRTLGSFEKCGIVRRVDLHRDAVLFELTEGRHHHHIVCTDCGLIEEFDECTIEKLIKGVVAKSSRFRGVAEHSLELFGKCERCS